MGYTLKGLAGTDLRENSATHATGGGRKAAASRSTPHDAQSTEPDFGLKTLEEAGDLLVTSSTPGHAMKGTDRSRMLGAVVGKALEPLAAGKGVIQVLVTLQ